MSACGNEREELDSGDYSPGALRALAIAAEADERDAAIALVDAKKLAEQYEHQERTEARRAEERNLEAAKRLDETLQTELDREEEAAETAAAVAAVAAVEEAEAAAAATATPTRWPIAIDGLNICREESYHDPEFQYARYFYERLQRFGDTPRGRRRPALVKPLLATIQALEDLGYEPTIFLPRYALNPRHEDCIVGYEQIRGLLRRAEGAGASITPVGGGKSNDDRVLLAWAVAHGAEVVSNDRYATEEGEGRATAEWLAKNVKRMNFVRGNQIVFRDPLQPRG